MSTNAPRPFCVGRDSPVGPRVLGLKSVLTLGLLQLSLLHLSGVEGIDFNSQIRPLLSDRCFQCHGADEKVRKAELRLDLQSGATGALASGSGAAIVPGDLRASVAWQRITSEDADERMPPADSKLQLSEEERALIGRWIEEGAQWKEHWAFVSPAVSPARFPEADPDWVSRNPIDRFIQRKLRSEGLVPAPEASRETLIRRLSFDLRGLPPEVAEVEAFVSNPSPDAYEQLVDRYLTSVDYAERMALEWLDVARYGDTQGMHGDPERFHWPWRDWVIEAFASNLPYDDFITWQLAGDLLPEPSRKQQLATAFHRNHPVSAEGGIIDEEFRVKYVQDRVNTTATAFLGLTLECATCHDHKFDPISQEEYYQFSAFFNNMKEIGMVAEGGGSSGPVLLLPDDEAAASVDALSARIDSLHDELAGLRADPGTGDSLASLEALVALGAPQADAVFPLDALRKETVPVKGAIHRVVRNTPIDLIVDENADSVASGEPELVPGVVGKALRFDQEYDLVFLRTAGQFEVNEPFSAGAWIATEVSGENQSVMGISGELLNAWKGWDFFLDRSNRLSIRLTGYWPHNYLQVTTGQSLTPGAWHHVAFTYDGLGRASGVRLFIDGQAAETTTDYDELYRTIVHSWNAQEGWPQKPVMVGRSGRFYTGENGVFRGSIDQIAFYNRYLTEPEVLAWWRAEAGPLKQDRVLGTEAGRDHWLHRQSTEARRLFSELRGLIGERLQRLEEVPEIMVLADQSMRRQTFVLERGQYDSPTRAVEPGTPRRILPFPDRYPRNRLGLAQWLVDPKNPLTARVTVNRYWQLIFGRGLVETPQDFGSQGAMPTHPELLDWLALQLIDTGWDVRALLKTFVTSATYRQRSVPSAEQRERDPGNRLLSRGPRQRLAAEFIRDNALAASGLLTRRVGGASVKPYQPEGLWVEKTGPGSRYQADSGERLYRKSLYTYIRRTTPHPAMIALDAPNRSVCVVKREQTNTPLQALVMLNDPQFVEAARVLAQRMQREGGAAVTEQIQYGFRLLCGRKLDPFELKVLTDYFETVRERYRGDEASMTALLQVGVDPVPSDLDPVRTAALTMVANTMMNYDEAFSKR